MTSVGKFHFCPCSNEIYYYCNISRSYSICSYHLKNFGTRFRKSLRTMIIRFAPHSLIALISQLISTVLEAWCLKKKAKKTFKLGRYSKSTVVWQRKTIRRTTQPSCERIHGSPLTLLIAPHIEHFYIESDTKKQLGLSVILIDFITFSLQFIYFMQNTMFNQFYDCRAKDMLMSDMFSWFTCLFNIIWLVG